MEIWLFSCALIGGVHGDHRRVDIGVFTHGQPLIGNKADQRQNKAHHRREDGSPDRNIGD
jgi:hypothetical protein